MTKDSTFKQGQDKFSKGHYQEAIAYFDQWIASSPRHAAGFYYRALAYRKMQDAGKALADLDQVLSLSPEDPDAFSERGVTKFYLKDNEGALADLDEALRLQPEKAYRYASRAYLKDKMGDLKGAWQDYQQAVTLDPEDAIARNNLGLIEQKMGSSERAHVNFKRADQLESYTSLTSSSDAGQDHTPASEENYTGNEQESNTAHEKGQTAMFRETLMRLFTSGEERSRFKRFLRDLFRQDSSS